MPKNASRVYHFDQFRLDPAHGVVLGSDDVEVRLRPKTFALLQYLLDNPGRLLSRDELLEALWPGVVVTDDSLTQCVSDLRQALGDRATQILRTVPKRGYVLKAGVRHDSLPSPEEEPVTAPVLATLRDLADRRRDPLTVHRFATPDGDRACILLADALVTDLIAELTRTDGIRVLPASDTKNGEGYHVKGEVRGLGENLRATVRLEDATTGAVLWAEQLDRPRDGSHEQSRAVLLALAAHLDWQVARHSLFVARRKPIADLTARELCLLGRDYHLRITEADTQVAREMFARAIAADPDYAEAYAWQAYTVHRAITHGWGSPTGQAARDEALRLARRAVQLQPGSPLCLARLAFALVLDQRWEEAVDVARAALNSGAPTFAPTRITCCEVLTAAGHPEEAAEIAKETLTLDPLCPPTAQGILGRALLLAGKVEEALPPLRWCASHLSDYAATYDTLVVAAVESGRWLDAMAARRELLRLKPEWVPRNHTGFWYFRRPEDLNRFQVAHQRAAELVSAPVTQQDLSDKETAVSRSELDSLHLEETASRPEDAKGLAALRQVALVVHPLEAEQSNAAATRGATVVTSKLVAELVRYEDLRIVGDPGNCLTQGFAIRGDVQSSGENLCAHLRLDDLGTGTTVWAQQIEWPSGRSTGLLDGSVVALAAGIDLQVGRRSLRQARGKPVGTMSARDLTLLGKEHYHRSTEAETILARQMFARAAALDPDYAPAHAWYALTATRVAVHDWGGPDRQAAVEQAVQVARRAVELEPDSPICLASLSLALALQEHWEDAVATARLAIRTGRVAGDGARIAAGDVLAAAGHPTEAEEALRHAIARDPHCFPIVHVVLGRALLLDGRRDEAMGELRRCLAQLPDYALGYRTLVVAAIEAGLVEDARKALREIVRLRPEWVQASKQIFWFLRRSEDQERYRKAFEMAIRLDAAAKAGGLLSASNSRA